MFCCFSGHRPHILSRETDYIINLKKEISNAIDKAIEDGYTDFYCGMAKGVDTYAAEIVLEKAKTDCKIKLHAAIPCENQEGAWSMEDKEKYYYLLSKCESINYTSKIYNDRCMLLRNEFMVNNSDRLIAVWNGQMRGGTAYTVRYAKKCGKEIYLIRTKDLSHVFI